MLLSFLTFAVGRRRGWILLVSWCTIMNQAQAESAPIVISAARAAQQVDETLASVVVITGREIEQSQAQDVSELLRLHAGVDLARNGGRGQSTSIFLRGAKSNHTLVLLDGVKINPGTLGTPALQHIALSAIERIEIVYGPRSSLYGSDAVGGVVHIITRRTPGVSFHLGGGTDGARALGVVGGVARGAWRGGASANLERTDGFPTLVARDEDRGYRNAEMRLYGGYAFGQGDVEITHWQARGRTEYADDFSAALLDQDHDNFVSAVTLKLSGTKGWQHLGRISRMRDRLEQNQADDFADTRRLTTDWQSNVSVDAHALSFGVTLQQEKTKALSFGTTFNETASGRAVFVQDIYTQNAHRLLGAARLSSHPTAGTTFTWNAAYGYHFTPHTQAWLSAGTAFRTPDATDRFGFGGNPSLKPERARTVELGWRHTFLAAHTAEVALFDTRLQELIGWDGTQSINIARAHIQGIAAKYHYRHGPWRVGAEVGLQDPDNLDTDKPLARRSPRSAAGSLTYDPGRYLFRLEMVAQSTRKDSDFSAYQNAGYGLFNLSAALRWRADWTLQGRIDNLFDKDYTLAHGYNTQGRAFYISLVYASAK